MGRAIGFRWTWQQVLALVWIACWGGSSIHAQGSKLPSSVVLFKSVRVFDGVQDRLRDVDVLVVGEKIQKVAAEIPASGVYEVNAANKGRYLIGQLLADAAAASRCGDLEISLQRCSRFGTAWLTGRCVSHYELLIALGSNMRNALLT